MNREKHLRLVQRTLQKGIEAGFSSTQIAEAIVSRIERAIEDEMEEAELGLVTDFPIIPKETVTAIRPDLDKLGPPPAAPGLKSSIIIAPDSPEAREVLKNPTPIRLAPPGAESSEDGNQKYWDQGNLREYINANTPQEIQVFPKGREKPITLVRQLDVLPGIDGIKLTYKLGIESQTVGSQQNSKLGETLGKIAIDTSVSETFTCYDRNPPVADKMGRIREAAEFVYRPRPAEIPSTTPRHSGYLGFGEKDPHDSVGPLVSPTTGKEW